MTPSETDIYTPMFDENPKFYKSFLEVLGEGWITKVTNIELKKLKQRIKSTDSESYSILDIGTARGSTLIRLLKLLIPHAEKQIKVDCLDPSIECFNGFKKRIKLSGLQHCLNSYDIKRWEQYSPKIKYDYIRAIESWFGITEWEISLRKFYNTLKPRGLGLIVIESEENDFVKFKLEFCPRLFKNYTVVHGKEICRVLDNSGIPYIRENIMVNEIDIGCCYPEPNTKGRLFLSYLLRYDFEKLSDQLKREIGDYFRNNYLEKKFRLFNDFIWVKNE